MKQLFKDLTGINISWWSCWMCKLEAGLRHMSFSLSSKISSSVGNSPIVRGPSWTSTVAFGWGPFILAWNIDSCLLHTRPIKETGGSPIPFRYLQALMIITPWQTFSSHADSMPRFFGSSYISASPRDLSFGRLCWRGAIFFYFLCIEMCLFFN